MTNTPPRDPMRPRRVKRRASLFTLPFLSLGLASVPFTQVQAADGTWNIDAAGDWNSTNTSPWLDGTIAQGPDFTAYFKYNIAGARTVTLRESLTIGNLWFEDITTASHDWTLARSGSVILTLQTTTEGSTPTITVGGGAGRSATISAVLGGNQGLIKEGNGKLILSGTNIFVGTTTINAGTLQLGADSGSGSVTGDIVINNNAILKVQRGNANTITGNITGTGSVLVANSSNALTLTGNNTYSGGTTLSDGKLYLGSGTNNGIGSGKLTIGRGTIASADSDSRTITNELGLNISGNLVFGDTQSTGARTGDLTFTDATAGNGPGVGNTITVTNSTTTTLYKQFTGGQITKAGTGTLILNAASSVWGATTVNGGTLVVNGAKSNTSSQTVTVNDTGTLQVNGSFSANNVFTINAGGTLGGSGTIGGTVTVNSGATLAPGNSPGTLTTGSQEWLGGANYAWEVLDFNGTMGTTSGYDLISISGTLNLAGLSSENRFNINLLSLASTGGLDGDVSGAAANFNSSINGSWTIVTTTGGISGYGSDASLVGSLFNTDTSGFSNAFNGVFSIGLSANGNDLVLNYSAIPEPSTYAAIAGALALGAVLIRRRRRAQVQA